MKQILSACLILAAIWACSKGDLVRSGVRIASTGDIIGAAKQLGTEKAVRYAANPKALQRDILKYQKDIERLFETLRKAVGGEWGKEETREPQPKVYVKYTQNYLSRASVDFDNGLITVETLDRQAPSKSLKNAIATTLLTPDDPRAVDLYTAKSIKLGAVPFLFGEVKDHEGQDIRWSWRAERFADHLIQNKLQVRTIQNGNISKTVHYVTIAMIQDHLQVRAQKYRSLVERFANEFSISKNLVYAIMKTESDFNPYAISPAPAFGLMQVVPTTAGQDVHKFLNRSGLPSKNFLLEPQNNIQYGTAYLHLLNYKYLNDIQNPVSREYCVIAAYNTGAGNVLRTFDPERERASRRINSLEPLQVYNTLRETLSHDEARRYLVKVLDNKKEFVNF